MNTFSKSLASTIRISYMVLPTALAEAFYKNLGFYACTVSNLEQYTLAKFISEGYFEKHINRMRIRYKQKKDLILKEMKRCGLLKLAKIDAEDAGLHFLLRVCGPVPAEKITRRAAENGRARHRTFGVLPYSARKPADRIRYQLLRGSRRPGIPGSRQPLS